MAEEVVVFKVILLRIELLVLGVRHFDTAPESFVKWNVLLSSENSLLVVEANVRRVLFKQDKVLHVIIGKVKVLFWVDCCKELIAAMNFYFVSVNQLWIQVELEATLGADFIRHVLVSNLDPLLGYRRLGKALGT